MVIRRFTRAPNRCFATWRWRVRMAASAVYCRGLAASDVLVIDDWAMAPLSEPERRDFWEICEDRYQNALDDPHFATAGLALA